MPGRTIAKTSSMPVSNARLAAAGGSVLYITGEESAAQVRGRAERIGAVTGGLGLVATTELATALGVIGSETGVVMITRDRRDSVCAPWRGCAPRPALP